MSSWPMSEIAWGPSISCLSHLQRNPVEFYLMVMKSCDQFQKVYADHGILKNRVYFLLLEIVSYKLILQLSLLLLPSNADHCSLCLLA